MLGPYLGARRCQWTAIQPCTANQTREEESSRCGERRMPAIAVWCGACDMAEMCVAHASPLCNTRNHRGTCAGTVPAELTACKSSLTMLMESVGMSESPDRPAGGAPPMAMEGLLPCHRAHIHLPPLPFPAHSHVSHSPSPLQMGMSLQGRRVSSARFSRTCRAPHQAAI